jgi:hypothetical protein
MIGMFDGCAIHNVPYWYGKGLRPLP